MPTVSCQWWSLIWFFWLTCEHSGLVKDGLGLLILGDILGCEVRPVEFAVPGLDCLISTLLEEQLHHLIKGVIFKIPWLAHVQDKFKGGTKMLRSWVELCEIYYGVDIFLECTSYTPLSCHSWMQHARRSTRCPWSCWRWPHCQRATLQIPAFPRWLPGSEEEERY